MRYARRLAAIVLACISVAAAHADPKSRQGGRYSGVGVGARASSATPAPNANGASVVQEGAGNAAAISQGGAGNLAGIRQFGKENSASIAQTGDQNAGCIVQIGRRLDTGLVQTGGETAAVLQTKKGNRDIPMDLCMTAELRRGFLMRARPR